MTTFAYRKTENHLTPKTRKGSKTMIQEFLHHQRINKGLADGTINEYRKDLKTFTDYALPLGLSWSKITAHDMDKYVEYMTAQKLQPATIKKRIEVVRLALEYAVHQGWLTTNPARYTQTPKLADRLPKTADGERLETFIKEEAKSREELIVKIMTAVLYDTGMRIGELCAMRGEDINTQEQSVRIVGKGNKERYVYYGERSARWFKAMSYRRGRIFTEDAMSYRYKMYEYLPGVNPHSIRHAYAVRQLAAGMPLKTLSVLMGHKHQATTEIYARMSTGEAAKQYRAHYN